MTATHEVVERTSVIRLEGEVSQVFPLFGPLRERDWAEGWNPIVICPADETVRERMVFVVQHGHEDGPETLWVVSKHDEDQATIEYTVFEPDSIHWILIRCRAAEDGVSTEAEITYTYVGTSKPACDRNERHLQSMYRHDLKNWETAINHYLRTGGPLSHR
ncbi:hypothetical protein JW848_10435 [Candidatus Bipolaricaulota bacterium]|nr:hypothetical protein [Candidatus Bipolaricaulota bacterium]